MRLEYDTGPLWHAMPNCCRSISFPYPDRKSAVQDPDDPAAIELLRRELQLGRHTRSPLAQWMFRHHAAFAALLRETGVNWERLAGGFEKLGLTDARGRPPRPQTAKLTWHRVRQTLEREGLITRRRRRTGKPAAANPASPPDSPSGGAPRPVPASRFQPVRKREPAPPRTVTPEEAAQMAALRTRVFGTKEE